MSQGIESGVLKGFSLAASANTEWFTWAPPGGSVLSIAVAFNVADAVGKLKVQSSPGQDVGFTNLNGDNVTELDVTSALNGTSFEFVIHPAGKRRYRLVYTRTDGGAADTIDIDWG
jgi:hypothetical protein